MYDKMIPQDKEFVILCAEALKKNPKIFELQKKCIDSQIEFTNAVFTTAFGKDFKRKAREYMRATGRLTNSPSKKG